MPINTPVERAAYAAAVLLLPAWAGVVGGELAPSDGGISLWDKVLHFTAYFVLCLLATVALKAGRRALWAALGLIAMGGALEIIQGMIGRDCNIFDELANTLGVISGGLLGWALVGLLAWRALVDGRSPL